MSNEPVTLAEAARQLGLKSAATIRGWLAKGAPEEREGKSGPGGSALVIVDDLRAWRAVRCGGEVVLVPTLDADAVARGLLAAQQRALEGDPDAVWRMFGVPRAKAAAILAGAFRSIFVTANGRLPDEIPAEIEILEGFARAPSAGLGKP